jgi:hypothetical protein
MKGGLGPVQAFVKGTDRGRLRRMNAPALSEAACDGFGYLFLGHLSSRIAEAVQQLLAHCASHGVLPIARRAFYEIRE